jgi:hypothetical protein
MSAQPIFAPRSGRGVRSLAASANPSAGTNASRNTAGTFERIASPASAPEPTSQPRPPPPIHRTSAISTDATMQPLKMASIWTSCEIASRNGSSPITPPANAPVSGPNSRQERPAINVTRAAVTSANPGRAATSASQKPSTRPTSRWLWTRSAYWTIRSGPSVSIATHIVVTPGWPF